MVSCLKNTETKGKSFPDFSTKSRCGCRTFKWDELHADFLQILKLGVKKEGPRLEVGSVGKGFWHQADYVTESQPQDPQGGRRELMQKVVLCLPHMPCHLCAGKDGGRAENVIRRLKIQKEGLKNLIFFIWYQTPSSRCS